MHFQDPLIWFEKNKDYFKPELNGYFSPPVVAYLTTLPLINNSGKILDLGAGNGMLLKFILDFADKNLVPFGAEKNKEPFEQLHSKIFPQFTNNFELIDVNDYDFKNGPFNIIITGPFYGLPNVNSYISKCVDNLSEGGRLILRVHSDVLKHYGLRSISESTWYNDFPLHTVSCGTIELATLDKS